MSTGIDDVSKELLRVLSCTNITRTQTPNHGDFALFAFVSLLAVTDVIIPMIFLAAAIIFTAAAASLGSGDAKWNHSDLSFSWLIRIAWLAAVIGAQVGLSALFRVAGKSKSGRG